MANLASVSNVTPILYGNSYQIGERVPNTIEFSISKADKWHKMHPRRYDMHDALLLYSYWDLELYQTWEWQQILASRLLYHAPKDSWADFLSRLHMSLWANGGESGSAIEKILGSVFGGTITRSLGPRTNLFTRALNKVLGRTESEDLKEWLTNVDGLGLSLTEYMRRAHRSSLIYGTSYSLIELPDDIPGPDNALSDDDQRPFIRPILTNFKGLEVLNWENDRRGRVSWVMFVRMFWKDAKRYWRWYEVTEEEIIIYEAEKSTSETPQEVARGTHGLGCVPIVCHYGIEKEETMVGVSFLLRLAELQVAKFRSDSNIPWVAHQAAHAQIIAETEAKELDETYLSSNHVIKLKPSLKENIRFLTIDKSALDMSIEVSNKLKDDLRDLAEFDPMASANVGSIEASGYARKLSNALTERRAMIQHADRVEEAETRLLRMVHYIIEGEWTDDVISSYPDEFALSSPDAVGDAYIKHKDTLGKLSPTWSKTMLEEIARSLIGNRPDVNEQIKQEIEQNYESTDLSPDQDETQDESQDEMTEEDVRAHHLQNPDDEFDMAQEEINT